MIDKTKSDIDKIKLDLICDECGKSIMVSEDLQKLIDAIPVHRKTCKRIETPKIIAKPKEEKQLKTRKIQ